MSACVSNSASAPVTSSGRVTARLAVLIGGARRVAGFGARLRLVAASRAVTRPLQVTGADALFDTFDDVASALAAAALDVAPPPGVAPPSGEVGR